MRIESNLFMSGVIFFLPVAVVYGMLTDWKEPVGPVGLVLLACMCLMIGGYLRLTGNKLDARPEEDPAAYQSDSQGEYGFFSPHSWWPLPLAAGAAITFIGLGVGWWIFIVGVVFSMLALIGWSFEYFRGDLSR